MDSIVEFYSRIYWENKSDSLKTPLGKTNLNHMDSAIKLLDTRTVALYAETVRLDEVKADKTQLDGMIVNWEFDEKTGIIKITRYDGAVSAINTTLNKLAVNFIYDAINEKLIITQTDGAEVEVDMSALITQYEFLDSDTITFSVDTNGKVSAIIKEGSIGEKHLNPDYLAEIKIDVAKAQGYATNAQESASNAAYEAKLAQSYSVGGSGVRDEEDSDNSKYYYELTKNIVSNANTIESSKITYQISPNGTEVPSGAWQAEIPEIQQGMFLWTKIVINYSNGSNSTFYSVAYSGIDGIGGSAGGIVKNEAYLADSQERILLASSGQKILLPEYSKDVTILDTENYSDYTIFQKTGVDNGYVNRTDLKPQLIDVIEDTLIDGFLKYWTILNIGAYENPNHPIQSFRTQLLFPYQNDLEDTEMFIRTAAMRDDGTPYWRPSRRTMHDGNYSSMINKINNQLLLDQGSFVSWMQAAGPGQSGYINFARITIIDNYANHSCFFVIQRRNLGFPIFLSVGFMNENNLDPGLGAFYYWGSTDYGIYISKKDVSTWDLWSLKSEAYDAVEILQMNVNMRYFKIEFPNGYRDVKEEQWISPTEAGRVAGANHIYDAQNGYSITGSYSKPGLNYSQIQWLNCWNGYEMRAIHKNNFTYLKVIDNIYGMCVPGDDSVSDESWIRTPKPGIIPYSPNSSSGVSRLGYDEWPFAEIYGNHLFTNEIHQMTPYQTGPNGFAHSLISFNEGNILFTGSSSSTNGIIIQVNVTGRAKIFPERDNSAYLGTLDKICNQIYSTNAAIQTSDRNQKKDISYIGEDSEYENTNMSDELLIQFVRSLKPCVYLRRDGESGRPHHGFISNDFKKSMDEVGIADHAAYIKSPKMETIEKEVEQEREVYDEVEKKTKIVKEKVKTQEEKVIDGKFNEGLRYEEIIPDVTRFCQILYQQNQEQQEIINLQQEEINELKVRLEILEKIVVQA